MKISVTTVGVGLCIVLTLLISWRIAPTEPSNEIILSLDSQIMSPEQRLLLLDGSGIDTRFRLSPIEMFSQCSDFSVDIDRFDNQVPFRRTGQEICVKSNGSNSRYSYISSQFLSIEGAMPYWMVAGEETPSNKDRVAVFLVGGPQDAIFYGKDSQFTKLLEGLTSQFQFVIIPGYYGTSSRDAFPRSNVSAAALELSLMVHSISSDIKITVFGYSSGSMFAHSLASHASIDNIVYINPLITSMEQHYRRKGNLFIQSGYPSTRFARFVNNGLGYDFGVISDTYVRRTNMSEWIKQYFGAYYDNKTIFAVDANAHNVRCAIVFGGNADVNTGPYEMEMFKSIRFVPIFGLDHVIDTPIETNALLRSFESPISRSCLN